MNSHKRGFLSKFTIILLIVLVITVTVLTKLTQYVESLSKKVVLDDDGYRVEITTYDSSVEQLLDRYKITLGPGDEITPSIEEALQDNTEIMIRRAMKVSVVADGHKEVLHVTGGTVREVLERANVSLGDHDIISKPLDQQVMPFDSIEVTRTMPVTLVADGHEEVLHVVGGTVQEILAETNVSLREQDIVNYPLSHQVKPNDSIKVTRVDEEIETETEAIPYKVVTKNNDSMNHGVTKVVQEGQQGELERKTLVTYHDGVEINRKLVSEKVTVKPQNRVIEKGTVKRVTTGRGDSVRYTKTRKMVATAYTANDAGMNGKGITASGSKVKPFHTIAAPPDIPFGTKVYIPELVKYWASRGVSISGIFTVEDRGSAIKGNKIDIYMEDKSMSRNWGRRSVTIYILR
jgi:uncharacterized protein YabE (DUF348 family)